MESAPPGEQTLTMRPVRRARAGLQDENRPIGSFLFLGPTGVGKTELTKQIAKFIFGKELLYTFDMSEFLHLDQVKLQLSREPYPLPKLQINRKPSSVFDYKFEDFEILNYQYHPGIKAPIAV